MKRGILLMNVIITWQTQEPRHAVSHPSAFYGRQLPKLSSLCELSTAHSPGQTQTRSPSALCALLPSSR